MSALVNCVASWAHWRTKYDIVSATQGKKFTMRDENIGGKGSLHNQSFPRELWLTTWDTGS